MLESQCPSIRSLYFYPKANYENLYRNIKRWKCRRKKILQADSTGRVRLKLIVRDFSYLQPPLLRPYLENCVHICWKKIGDDIFKADTAQNELCQKENWHKTQKAWDISRNHQLTLFKVFSNLQNCVEKIQEYPVFWSLELFTPIWTSFQIKQN